VEIAKGGGERRVQVAEASAVVPPSSEQRQDYLKVAAQVPGEQAFTTLADSRYALIRTLIRKSAVDPGAGNLEENG
jgi:hypothetical protein